MRSMDKDTQRHPNSRQTKRTHRENANVQCVDACIPEMDSSHEIYSRQWVVFLLQFFPVSVRQLDLFHFQPLSISPSLYQNIFALCVSFAFFHFHSKSLFSLLCMMYPHFLLPTNNTNANKFFLLFLSFFHASSFVFWMTCRLSICLFVCLFACIFV